ncbi:uncharacterized protein LOC142645048 [Dermatophagoides pteronyssinus]|uniref:uncharacterized protein LOC142645048 n=1 Tax=Dermatophagoides pteronyssinus TaxID=6956 RepID=UPI003F674043
MKKATSLRLQDYCSSSTTMINVDDKQQNPKLFSKNKISKSESWLNENSLKSNNQNTFMNFMMMPFLFTNNHRSHQNHHLNDLYQTNSLPTSFNESTNRTTTNFSIESILNWNHKHHNQQQKQQEQQKVVDLKDSSRSPTKLNNENFKEPLLNFFQFYSDSKNEKHLKPVDFTTKSSPLSTASMTDSVGGGDGGGKISSTSSSSLKRRPINRGPRIPFTTNQVQELENKFIKTQYLSSLEVNQLAKRLNLSDTRVRIWFQNRRAREKREHQQQQQQQNLQNGHHHQLENNIDNHRSENIEFDDGDDDDKITYNDPISCESSSSSSQSIRSNFDDGQQQQQPQQHCTLFTMMDDDDLDADDSSVSSTFDPNPIDKH